jgi:hypothetical protein
MRFSIFQTCSKSRFAVSAVLVGSALTAAIRAADLPSLLERHFPNSLERGFRVRPLWRSESRATDAALKRFKDGAWVLTDFALSKSWNAYQFLTDLCSYAPREAARLLIAETGTPDTTTALTSPVPQLLEPETLAELPECLTDFLRLNRLYFAGRLTHNPDGTVSNEAQTYLLEPLAGWIASVCADFGIGKHKEGGEK